MNYSHAQNGSMGTCRFVIFFKVEEAFSTGLEFELSVLTTQLVTSKFPMNACKLKGSINSV